MGEYWSAGIPGLFAVIWGRTLIEKLMKDPDGRFGTEIAFDPDDPAGDP